MRTGPDLTSEPLSLETQERLYSLAETRWPGRVRRALDICPSGVNRTVDNEADALESIRRLEGVSRG